MQSVRACMFAIACLALPADSRSQTDSGAQHAAPAQLPPAWAYPVNPPDMPVAPDDSVAVRIPHVERTFLPSQLRDLFFAPDWHPKDHAAMPDVVARGRKPNLYACGYCHLPDGGGRPENTSLAGLPAAYIVQQVADFKSGARRTAIAVRAPSQLMIALAQSVTSADIKAAAEYFSRLPPRHRVKVVETDVVPHTYVAGWILAADKTAPKEPIGGRIIEVPEDLEQFEHRDTRVQFVAYAPVGSVEAGQALVKFGVPNRTSACTGCHGASLTGAGTAPSIAVGHPAT
jgi:cytochrome c553